MNNTFYSFRSIKQMSLVSLMSLTLLTACSRPQSNASPVAAQPSSQPSSLEPGMPAAFPSAAATATPVPSSAPVMQPIERPVIYPSPSSTPAGLSANQQAYRDAFAKQFGVQPFLESSSNPLSTFAVDVDTGAYSLARSSLNNNQLPPANTVRPEEYLNYFDYHYAQPPVGKFALYSDLHASPFAQPQTRLLRIGLQARQIADQERKQARLTFVIDVSGSMNRDNRLELAKQSLRLLVEQLRADDQIGIVIYGSTARVVLPHTPVSQRQQILNVIEGLRPEGSTDVEAGLTLGYTQAAAAFQSGALNRVILCSDGVANVGERGPEAILDKARSESTRGITLTTLGFGFGQYNDQMMEQLANQGDGTYAYIDTLDEARRILQQHLTSTLQIIAKDAKLQVSFNPDVVVSYRLIGYENRQLADQDFRNDAIDAGEVGSNHSVTAVYELRLKEATVVAPSPSERPSQNDAASGLSVKSFNTQAEAQGLVATVSLRYLDVDDFNQAKELSHVVTTSQLKPFGEASGSMHLAVSVAALAEALRGSVYAEGLRLSQVTDLARTAQRAYPADTKISEYLTLTEKAATLLPQTSPRSLDALALNAPEGLSNWRAYLAQQLGRSQ